MPSTLEEMVLSFLKNKSDFYSLPQLLDELPLSPSPRSLRRTLSRLVEKGEVIKEGITKNARYRALSREFKAESNQHLSKFGAFYSKESVEVLEKLNRPLFERTPVSYHFDWVDAYQPNITRYIPFEIIQDLSNQGKRENKDHPAGTYAHQIFPRLLIDLSYNSSRLEGNTYSPLDTERLLMRGITAEGKLDAEKVMLLNHKEAIRYLIDTASHHPLSTQMLCTIHYLLSDGLVEPECSGRVRKGSVRVGGSTYIPLEEPQVLERQLEKITEIARQIDNPFEQSFFLLVHISYLQAFIDVNKRTARLCANIPLITNNCVPLSFNDVGVSDYVAAMIAVYELNATTPLVDLYKYTYARSCAVFSAISDSLGYDEVRVKYRLQRRAVTREIILRSLGKNDSLKFAKNEAEKFIQADHVDSFIEDVMDDLELMDAGRLVGLGVTTEELLRWKASYA